MEIELHKSIDKDMTRYKYVSVCVCVCYDRVYNSHYA